ncbi:FtsK/SpoIIIE domain-containing protein [Salinibacterium hongtaonis]|uniref:FtsK/SpoIIIE domain-containing protein n=1 Tax=Homoserinimonas hongtaonis TaxID=2079791 RepID=UPI000D34BFDC|nr:FtsK/SpoIIIE domain-containing protein [Salinibacterium hongtaonis]AWB88850.1 hypothetical protein C2138_04170 [Salinibacterium hongtaonis]
MSIRISLPRKLDAAPPFSFPFMATLAPVAASVAMWAITSSPFALMFAFLGPLIAIGSLVDSRLQAGRRERKEHARFAAEAEAARRAISHEHDRIRQRMLAASRSAATLIPASVHDAERWRHSPGALPLVLGTGPAPSGIELAGDDDHAVGGVGEQSVSDAGEAPARGKGRSRRRRADRERARAQLVGGLRQDAALLTRAPITVDATLGIGICGPSVLAKSLARAVTIQLADRLSPADFDLVGGWERWHTKLPHFRAPRDPVATNRLDFVRRSAGRSHAERFVVVLAQTEDQLPRECRVGLEVSGGEVRVLRHPHLTAAHGAISSVPELFRAELISREEAELYATVLQRAAESEGLGPSRELPALCDLGSVWDVSDDSQRGLSVAFAVDEGGAVILDIVRDGPHAVIGGTTGSGKSELLISWVLALARRYPPDVVNLLLVDFKGGASFADVEQLQHCVGVVTDLDRDGAERALASLRAEVMHRERALAERGLRSIDDAVSAAEAGLPRLVVVVDEFAAMVSDFPELHSLFSDLAARGRSLGIHLILCTQSPARAVRDSVMANCTLRLSLRVNNAHDSSAVIGTTSAAELPQHPVGRCLVSVAGAPPRLVQVAQAAQGDALDVVRRWGGVLPARRPWLPSLPAVVSGETLQRAAELEGVAVGSTAFGILDRPQSQSQPVAVWNPREHGTVLVVGGHGVGKTSALAALAGEGPATWLTGDIEELWDGLVALTGALLGAERSQTTVIVDDLDAILARCPDPWAPALADMLTTLLRDGPPSGLRIALSAQRLTPVVQSLASLCDTRLILRMPSRQDHLLAGGQGAEYDASAVRGRGWWRGERVQVVAAGAPAPRQPLAPATARMGASEGDDDRSAPSARLDFATCAERGLVVVTNRPVAVTSVLCRLYPGAPVISRLDTLPRLEELAGAFVVADPSTWQGAWLALSELRSRMPVVFDRCSASEFRLVSGNALLPPPLAGRGGGAWLLTGEGEPRRVQMPEGL